MSLAVVIHAPRDLRLEATEVPALGPKDVEVRIAAGGICGSDLHYYQDGGFGTIRIKDATCPAIHAALQASEKGIPFMPLRGIVGSDLVKYRPDWKVIDNPMGLASVPNFCSAKPF